MRARVVTAGNAADVLSLLSDRVKAALGQQATFAFESSHHAPCKSHRKW